MIWPLDYRYTQFLGIPVWKPAQFGSKPSNCPACGDIAVVILRGPYLDQTNRNLYLCPEHMITQPWRK